MNRTEQAAARREAELQEALGHLEYFKRMGLALDQAMKVMTKDLQVCKKNEQIWEKRIEKIQLTIEDLGGNS